MMKLSLIYILVAGLFALVTWGFLQIFVPLGQTAETIYSLLGAILFSAFIVFDTHQLIKTYDLDQARPSSFKICFSSQIHGQKLRFDSEIILRNILLDQFRIVSTLYKEHKFKNRFKTRGICLAESGVMRTHASQDLIPKSFVSRQIQIRFSKYWER